VHRKRSSESRRSNRSSVYFSPTFHEYYEFEHTTQLTFCFSSFSIKVGIFGRIIGVSQHQANPEQPPQKTLVNTYQQLNSTLATTEKHPPRTP